MIKAQSGFKTEEKTALVVVGISSFLTPFLGSALNVALPAIGHDLSINAVLLGWVITAYLLAAAVALLPCGGIADMVGRKKLLLAGMLIHSCASIVCALAPSAGILLAGRVVNGIGGAMGFTTSTAILMSVIRPHERGKAIGWNVAAVYLGLSLGPPLGGFITHNLGWHWIFGLSAAAGIAVFALAKRGLPDDEIKRTTKRPDLAGSAIYGASLIALIYGTTRLPLATGIALAIAGLAGLVFFVRLERRLKNPILDVAIFAGNPVFTFSNLAALINYAATSAVGFLLSLYLQYSKGMTAQHAGLILVAQPVFMTIFSPLSGRLSDRIPAGKIASTGMALAVVTLTGFAFIRQDTNMWFVVAGLAILGLSFALFSSPNTNAVMSSVDGRHYGIASGILATMRVLGQTMSMSIVGLILAHYIGKTQITAANLPEFLRGFRIAFAFFACLCLVGVFASLIRSRKQRKKDGF